MINIGKTHDEVSVVNDQIGTPTYCFDLARLLVDMRETNKYGYYYATNEGELSVGMTSVLRFINSMDLPQS
jgi:dTDP-4-dehydrorhamnose reductase